MKAPLTEFLMEDWLERHRFAATFNAGESGHRAQSLADMLLGLQPDFEFDLQKALLGLSLCDAPNMGLNDLRFEVARMHPGASVDNVLITTGTSEALLLLLRQLQPKKVAVIRPAFQLLTEIPRSLGADIIPLPLHWDDSGKPSAPIAEWVETLRHHSPDVFVFNHPHNPSGLVFTDAQVATLLDECDSLGCTVIGDEHYRFLAGSREAASGRVALGRTLWTPQRKRFVTGSFIKCAGTPGLRIGWCVGHPHVLAAMQSEKNYLTHTVNPLSQQLATWFLQSFHRSQTFFAPLFGEWQSNREALREWLQINPLWQGACPEGGLVSCVFPQVESSEADLFERLRKRGVFLLPLSSFSETGNRSFALKPGFRLGLGLSHNQFKEMLSVMVL